MEYTVTKWYEIEINQWSNGSWGEWMTKKVKRVLVEYRPEKK
jgi:hypothetical protein